MTELAGAERIAAHLSELAGIHVSKWQVYRMSRQRSVPIERDRERWTIKASRQALDKWWAESRLARRIANRLKTEALGTHGAHMRKGRGNLVIYAKSGKTGELRVVGTVGQDGLTTNAFLEAISAIGDVDSIRVIVNSEGGLVTDGLAIYHELRTHAARVDVEIIGVAASMASAIAMAGDKISMAEDGLFMLHDPWSGAVGNADDLRAAADMLDKYGDSLAGIYARRTKYTEAQVLEMMGRNGGDGTWMNAREALEAGFIDEILAPAEARLPQLPAAALAKRLSKPRRGDPPMNKFLQKLAQLIKAMAKGDVSRDDVLDELAVQSELSIDAVENVLKGEQNPTLPQLRAFADVLGVAAKDLRELAEQVGVKFEAPSRRQADPQDPRAQVPGDVGAAVREALAAERQARVAAETAIRREAERFHIPAAAQNQIVAAAADEADGRRRIMDWLADPQNRPGNAIGGPNPFVLAGDDDRDKWLDGVGQWLVIKSGNARMVEAHTRQITGQAQRLDPGEFRGFQLVDIARACVERLGINVRGMSAHDIVKAALTPRAAQGGLGTTSDFPILLENVLHKLLRSAYETAADQWRSVAAVGSVNDFRAHPRLRLGSLPRLSALLESGEFKQMHFPDAEKESIQASTFGNLIGLSRQSIVNDDVDGFTRLTVMLGRAAARSIEIDVFALFALNSGLGPTMADGNTLFHADHNNIAATGGVPSQALLEESRVLMANQQDPDSNDFLNLRPAVWVGPIGLGAATRAAVNAEFDFDAATEITDTAVAHKFMKPNVVRDLVSTIVDTPRLTGNRWYLLADPSIAPVIEVVFLDGMEGPSIRTEEGFGYDGIRWEIKSDYGVGATDTRGATTNAGS